ncbi:unnamed protein product [Lactuca saligna]|uniref:Uncharacterized protein n=1 Tax=Lactuca saligna TaxID=75948 RepID=A0AA35ZAU6_LACSI|nr:unnamed protein product [Lactuca saligna]
MTLCSRSLFDNTSQKNFNQFLQCSTKLKVPQKELEAQEDEVKNAKRMLETQKTLFPSWSMECMQKEAIDDPIIYWLDPLISFDLNNDVECQLDFPITPRAFLFHCFEKIEKSQISDSVVTQKLHSFYLKYAKPQKMTWSLKKFCALRVKLSDQTEDFLNIQFKEEKYKSIVAHMKRMLICYIYEIAKMDIEIRSVLKKRPNLKPEEEPKDLHKPKVGKSKMSIGV